MIDFEAQGVLFTDLQIVMREVRDGGTKPLRIGQAAFNHLAHAYPDLAEKIRATEADCFYDDKKIPAFLDRIFELCNPAE